MNVLDYVLPLVRDTESVLELVGRAARRDPLLLRLGELYTARFHPGVKPGDTELPDEWEIQDLESQLGFPLAPDFATSTSPEQGIPAWKQYLLDRMLSVPSAEGQPEAVLVAGQPGSGKGTLTEAVCQYFCEEKDPAVIIDPDELEYLCPDRAAVGGLLETMLDRATAEKRHLIVDQAFGVDTGIALIERLHRQGYRVTVLALRVPPERSWQSATERFASHQEIMGTGRSLTRAEHDAAYAAHTAFIAAARKQALADVQMLTREGEVVPLDAAEVGSPDLAPAEQTPTVAVAGTPAQGKVIALGGGRTLILEGIPQPVGKPVASAGPAPNSPPPPPPAAPVQRTGSYQIELIAPPRATPTPTKPNISLPTAGNKPAAPANPAEPPPETDSHGNPLTPEHKQQAIQRRQGYVDTILGKQGTDKPSS
jgi:hypothetical protein